MRIIAGKFRGRIIKSPETDIIRPTVDRVREAIFGVVQMNIQNGRVLDLFCGTGAMGIEAISRYANEVYFVDREKSSLDLAKSNLKMLGGEGNFILGDYMSALEKFKGQKFDAIFIDPPYATDYAVKAINYIDKNNMLNDNGVIVWEKAYTAHIELDLKHLGILKIKKYGTVQVVFIENLPK